MNDAPSPDAPSPDAPSPGAAPVTPAGRIRHWFDLRFRTAAAVYGLIVYTSFLMIGDDHVDADEDPADALWDLLLTAVITLLVFYIAHVFAHTLTDRERRMRSAAAHAFRRAVGMLYAAVPATAVLLVSALQGLDIADAVWFALLTSTVTLGILGYAAYTTPGVHVGRRIAAGFVTALLGVVVIILEYAIH